MHRHPANPLPLCPRHKGAVLHLKSTQAGCQAPQWTDAMQPSTAKAEAAASARVQIQIPHHTKTRAVPVLGTNKAELAPARVSSNRHSKARTAQRHLQVPAVKSTHSTSTWYLPRGSRCMLQLIHVRKHRPPATSICKAAPSATAGAVMMPSRSTRKAPTHPKIKYYNRPSAKASTIAAGVGARAKHQHS